MCFYWEDQKEIEADIRASLGTWHLSPVSEICPRHSITLKKKKKKKSCFTTLLLSPEVNYHDLTGMNSSRLSLLIDKYLFRMMNSGLLWIEGRDD